MGLLNIVSLPKHIDKIWILLSNQSLDILAVNETRLDYSFSISNVYVEGYDLIGRDRDMFGGGVCLYIRNNSNYTDFYDLVPLNLEAACLDI